MKYKFLVTGFSPIGEMKSQARKASHIVPGAEDKVGPSIRFQRYEKIIERPLTRRELVFGVKAPDDGKGTGFPALVSWWGKSDLSEVQIDMIRAEMVGAGDWIVKFVREIILAAGWEIDKEIDLS